MIKLCVGADSFEDHESWVQQRIAYRKRHGMPAEQIHTTRQMPRERDKVLDGGSLYWVIKGVIQCRQRIVDLRPVKGEDGISRCEIVLEPKLIRVKPRARKAFQGWRYLKASDVPPDLGTRAKDADAPPAEMARDLAELGLI